VRPMEADHHGLASVHLAKALEMFWKLEKN
jgi:hypothetical protein